MRSQHPYRATPERGLKKALGTVKRVGIRVTAFRGIKCEENGKRIYNVKVNALGVRKVGGRTKKTHGSLKQG